ncbi:MAG: CehA/McbA family metallohydrolase [Candidatus Omnitrophica bacterium]|nr:CehA/McbA family metallohydrolase [Candidatus Omnitrophota bacterium]
MLTRFSFRPIALLCLAIIATIGPKSVEAEELPLVEGVEFQPFASATGRLLEALEFIGSPMSDEDTATVKEALQNPKLEEALETIQKTLDKYVLIGVQINPESRVKVKEGMASKELMERGWKSFLVKVHNEAGVTAKLEPESPNSKPMLIRSTGKPDPDVEVAPNEVLNRFLEIEMVRRPPMKSTLSGLLLEYRIIQLYSRDEGKREAIIGFNVGQGTQDLGFRNEVPILFTAVPAVEVTFKVKDFDGSPVMAEFRITDDKGHVYPARARRLAPDFFFHDQVYRKDGEHILLPPGEYTVEYTRGPEYLKKTRTIDIPHEKEYELEFDLERWIHVADLGWRSGDHHVHAAGCSHYDAPTQGVTPQDMWRHILGEDLNVGCVLTWGPCWYYQKQFFEGETSELSTDNYVMRYDVEVSGFPSSHAGHLSLLRLSEDDYKGVETIEEWPSWDLPVLQWCKEQGGVAGFSHSGWGLMVDDDTLPSYKMPPFDGIGANEYIVDVVHGAVDFISAVDTPVIWELSIWYHTLNCGYRTKISGETDFPCIYGDRVGLGRSYVKLPEGPLDYDQWAYGVRDGRNYVSDGYSHLLDFKVNDVAMGESTHDGPLSQLNLPEAATVTVTARIAAFLEEKPDEKIRHKDLDEKPYWHIERARIDDTRKVPLDLVVNGKAVQTQEILADGEINDVTFELPLEKSSWIALRVFPSSHSNPIFAIVDSKPIRADEKSAEWCLEAVDVCWDKKSKGYRAEEIDEAQAAYDVARKAYKEILDEIRGVEADKQAKSE